MKLIYLGSDAIGSRCLAELAGGPHEIVAVVTQPDRRAGRGRRMQPTAIKKQAEQLGLTVRAVEYVNAPGVVEEIRKLAPDLLVTFAFNQKLSRQVLESAGRGAINVHPSLLPKYRGAAPVARAILNGERETGISIIRMVEDLDAGEVLAQERYDIYPEETTGELEQRLGEQAAPLLAKVVEEIAGGTAESRPQDHEQATGAPKLKKSDGLLDFAVPAEELANRIRAVTPWPGAFCFFGGQARGKAERVVITRAVAAESVPSKAAVEPGTILADLSVQCGRGALRIKQIKPAGKKAMNWGDFVNGRLVRAGDRFSKGEVEV